MLYGVLTSTGGTATFVGGRQQVIDVTNVHGDYSYNITGTLQKTFFDNFQGSLAYNYMQARDIASTTSSTQGSNYRYQRDITGFLEDRSLTRAKNDMPHRIVATGSWRLRTLTDISFIYQGNSGAPFDYVYGAGAPSGSGDANADGQSQNDLIYVPSGCARSERNPLYGLQQRRGSPATPRDLAQADAFDRFIDGIKCLRENRGRMLSRNLCRNPWQNQIDVSVGQSLQAFGQQNLQLRLDVINFANLLNKKWGAQNFSDQNSTCGPICSATVLLGHTGNVGPTGAAIPAGTNNPGGARCLHFRHELQALERGQRFVQLPDAAVDAVQLLEHHELARRKAGGNSPAGFFLTATERAASLSLQACSPA